MAGFKRIAALAAVLVFAGAAIFGWRIRSRRHALERVAGAYADVRACLYGEPLGETEKASERVFEIEMCVPDDRAASTEACDAELVRALDAWNAIGDDGDAAHQRLRDLTSQARVAPGVAPAWLEGEPPLVDRLEAAIVDATLPSVPAKSGRARCTEKPRAHRSELAALGAVDPGATPLASTSPGRALRVSWPSPNLPSLTCWLAPDGAPRGRCGSPKLSLDSRIYASDDAFEDVVVRTSMSDSPGGRAYLGSSGEAIVDAFGYLSPSGWVRPDGNLVFQDRDEKLKVSPPKKHAEDTELPLGSARGETQLWVGPGFVVWMDKLGRSYLSPIGDDGVGERVDLGNVPPWSTVWTCQGKEGPVLALHSPRAEKRSAALFVLYPNGAEYAEAIEYASPFSERTPPIDVPFACSPSGAPRWAWVESQRVRELSCPPSGCVARVSEPLDAAKGALGSDGNIVHAAAPVGEDRVLVTRLLRGQRRLFMSQLRVLTAEIADLPTTKDVLVVGDLVPFDAPSWTHPEAFACGDTAWVTARLDGKLYAFRSTDGVRFEPVTLQ